MTRLFLAGVAATALMSLAACGDTHDDVALNNGLADPAADNTLAPTVDMVAQEAERMEEAQDFAEAAVQASLVQIRTGEMALERATDPEVKALAQELIDQNTETLEELRAAITTASLTPVSEVIDDFHMRRINDLDEDDGDEDFDKDFAALQVDAHSDAIKLYEDYARDGDLAPLTSWAATTLVDLKTAKSEAEALKKSLELSDS